jgi:NAD(P)-dependent dehydrogenase (short-subunit alcohol dehydrogenase family)
VFDLTGKVAIVTGGAGGLGRPISIGLAKAGADVVVDDLEKANPQAVADEIKALRRKALAVSYDVSSPEAMKELVDLVVKEFGKIDILMNTAGINCRFSAEEMPMEEYEKVVRFNTLGTFLPCQAVGRQMIEQKKGKIINMGSVRGWVAPGMGGTAYATSKGGVHQLTRTLAVEWAKYGINVNGIAPALVMTDMTRDFLSKPEIYSKMTAEIPLHRLGVPEDLLGAIILLASDASDFITGQIIYVDGGLYAA